MELLDRISALQSSAENQLHALNSKRKTENALILPFFSALGYDPFDVREVEPDFDVGLEEQGMKTVDYALKKNGSPVMLFQCEEAETDLGTYDNSFLFQYFDELGADVAVFTNGLNYRFYANLDAGINVHGRPFLGFNLLDHGPEQIGQLKQLTKPAFDTEEILSAAYELKCGRLLRDYFVQQQQAPDEHLVRFMAAQIYEGEVSGEVIEQFRPVVQKVLGEFVESEGTVQQAPSQEEVPTPSREEEVRSSEEDEERELETSEEEPSANREDIEEEDDPFDKDLARRVIEDF